MPPQYHVLSGGVRREIQMVQLQWVAVGPGRVALSHRPRLKDIPPLVEQGCQRLVTILGRHEQVTPIDRAVRQAGLAWTWVPVGHGKVPEGEDDQRMRQGLQELVRAVEASESILIHCSAGMHRTGMMAFALLRWFGLPQAQALELITTMRPETREGMREEHLLWGNKMAAEVGR